MEAVGHARAVGLLRKQPIRHQFGAALPHVARGQERNQFSTHSPRQTGNVRAPFACLKPIQPAAAPIGSSAQYRTPTRSGKGSPAGHRVVDSGTTGIMRASVIWRASGSARGWRRRSSSLGDSDRLCSISSRKWSTKAAAGQERKSGCGWFYATPMPSTSATAARPALPPLDSLATMFGEGIGRHGGNGILDKRSNRTNARSGALTASSPISLRS